MKEIRILVAEAQPVTQTGIISVLEAVEIFRAVGGAASVQEILTLSQKHRPDILLLAMHIPELQPVDLVARVRRHVPRVNVLILSDDWHEVNVRDMVMVGVSGFVDKTAPLALSGSGIYQSKNRLEAKN